MIPLNFGLLGVTPGKEMRVLKRLEKAMLFEQNTFFFFYFNKGKLVQALGELTLSNHQSIYFSIFGGIEKMRIHKACFFLNVSHLKN
jgi:hypothetical protein